MEQADLAHVQKLDKAQKMPFFSGMEVAGTEGDAFQGVLAFVLDDGRVVVCGDDKSEEEKASSRRMIAEGALTLTQTGPGMLQLPGKSQRARNVTIARNDTMATHELTRQQRTSHCSVMMWQGKCWMRISSLLRTCGGPSCCSSAVGWQIGVSKEAGHYGHYGNCELRV